MCPPARYLCVFLLFALVPSYVYAEDNALGNWRAVIQNTAMKAYDALPENVQDPLYIFLSEIKEARKQNQEAPLLVVEKEKKSSRASDKKTEDMPLPVKEEMVEIEDRMPWLEYEDNAEEGKVEHILVLQKPVMDISEEGAAIFQEDESKEAAKEEEKEAATGVAEESIKENRVQKERLRIGYQSGATTIPVYLNPQLEKISLLMRRHEHYAMVLTSYVAGSAGEEKEEARRVSLKRALTMREFFTHKGIGGERIQVRAMGIQKNHKTDEVILTIYE